VTVNNQRPRGRKQNGGQSAKSGSGKGQQPARHRRRGPKAEVGARNAEGGPQRAEAGKGNEGNPANPRREKGRPTRAVSNPGLHAEAAHGRKGKATASDEKRGGGFFGFGRAKEDRRSTTDAPRKDSKRPVRIQKPEHGERKPDSLKQDILRLLAKRPLDKAEISEALKLDPSLRSKLLGLMRDMEIAGEIARIRKDRYIIPKEADLFTGIIQVHASGGAHVLNEAAGEPDLYISAENSFTAMHGDRVVARIDAGRPGFREPSPARREGRVIRILTRANETLVGTLQKSKNFFYLVADDPRFVHNLYLQPPAPPLVAHVGDKVVAHLDSWPSRHVNPEGHIIEVLGKVGDPGVDMLSIIRKHNLPVAFPADVLRDAESVLPEVEAGEAARRVDLRNKFIFTIDPDDAKDFDDAIDVERTDDGWKLGIHIADVSHYVKPRSGLDREAKVRGNSVYLVDRVIPMLPEALSNGICSLKPGVDRLAFSVFAEVDRQGKVHSVRFAKSVIRSQVRLTYKQAFEILNLPPRGDTLAERVHTAWELASLLRKKRFAAGSLDLDFPELKVWLDGDGKPVRLERVENDISHQLIEEMMLLANELVGRELKLKRQPALYRIHEKPDPEKLQEFREFASGGGSHEPRGAQEAAHRAARTAARVGGEGCAAQEPQARALLAGSGGSLRSCEARLHALHEPDPPLQRSDRASCARAPAWTHKIRSRFAGAWSDRRPHLDHRAHGGRCRARIGAPEKAGVFPAPGCPTHGPGVPGRYHGRPEFRDVHRAARVPTRRAGPHLIARGGFFRAGSCQGTVGWQKDKEGLPCR